MSGRAPGSVVPLVRSVTVFALQYTVAVLAAVDLHDATTAATVVRAALLRQYFRQRRADIAA